jgi:hypothetical protein
MTIAVSANNGTAPASALSVLPGVNGNGSAHTTPHAVAQSYARIREGMRAAGLGDLVPSDGWSCYRDRAAQQHMRDLGLTTIPVGQSIHGEWDYGSAVDYSGLGGFGAPRHEWLRHHGGEYGWYQPGWAQAGGSLPEPWHWEYDQRGDAHLGEEDEMTPGEVQQACEEAIKGVLRAPEFQGYMRDLPWQYPINGPDPASWWLRDARLAPELHADIAGVSGQVDELAEAGTLRAWPSTLSLILAVAIIAGLFAGLISQVVEDGVVAGAATLVGGLVGWAASTVGHRVARHRQDGSGAVHG